MPIVIGVLKEPHFESRVSLLPEAVLSLTKKNITVFVEQDAGLKSFARDADYIAAGAAIKARRDIVERAEIILSVNDPGATDISNRILAGIYQPLYNGGLMGDWAGRGITCFSLDMLPRTTRAQAMDVLSSQANIAGYKAVIIAAGMYSRYLPMLMTAAGSIPPAKVLILGAGVAGLQAVATARRLGAVVEVFDTRPSVKEEVMSLGAKFIEVEGAADASKAGGYAVEQSADFQQRQKERIAASISRADIVITTAQIPGKKAPVLISEQMISAMRMGSIIMDLAAATGGNTELTKNNENVVAHGITIIGNSALAATMPSDASKLYGKNILNFLALIIDKEGNLSLDFNDELVAGACITSGNAVVHERLKKP